MVWLFLIPSIPSVIGNFVVPLMIGASDLAFPRLNLASWYLYLAGGLVILAALFLGGVDTGWTFYTPYSTMFSNSYVVLTLVGVFVVGFSSIADRAQLHRHDPHPARARAAPGSSCRSSSGRSTRPA